MTFLRKLTAGTTRQSAPSTGPGERIYAVGDIHGRYDLLCRMMDRIDAHSAALPPARQVHLVFLGDVIDRGPDSAKIIEHLLTIAQRGKGQICLLGNHEELMLAVLSGRLSALGAWLDLGGDATLQSYGVDPGPDKSSQQIVAEARAAIPQAHVDWIRQWPLSVGSGDYFFCHAGIKPGVAINRQIPSDLLWIRGEFLKSDRNHGAVIVHGHSISGEAEILPNRIGIDTGAYSTDVLTALYLEGDTQEILSVAP